MTKSAVAAHCVNEGHNIKEEIKLLEEEKEAVKLYLKERIHMRKHFHRLMNDDLDGVDEGLFGLISKGIGQS